MLGRRGPVQAAFTPLELKELVELAGADVFVDSADLELDPASEPELEAERERARRNIDLPREFAPRPAGSSAGRAASWARTRGTRRRPWSCCSRMHAPER